MAVPPAPVRVPSQRPLAPSVASVTSVTNDKVDNEMILGAVHTSPGICLTAEENPRKRQLEGHLMKGLCNQSLPQNEVCRIAQQVTKGEGRNEEKDEEATVKSKTLVVPKFVIQITHLWVIVANFKRPGFMLGSPALYTGALSNLDTQTNC